MEHPGKEAPLCSPNGKIKNKCVAAVALARQRDTMFAFIYKIGSLVCPCGRPFQPFIPSSIHPSSSFQKKKMMKGEENDDEWRQQQFMKNSHSLAICQKLQTNFKKLKIVEKKKRNKKRNLLKATQEFSN
jgi:hypothetical protein